jgi:hypothetical protein
MKILLISGSLAMANKIDSPIQFFIKKSISFTIWLAREWLSLLLVSILFSLELMMFIILNNRLHATGDTSKIIDISACVHCLEQSFPLDWVRRNIVNSSY